MEKTINAGCLATKILIEDRRKIGYMYREKPDFNSQFSDSGWRFFAGLESDAYVNDPNNIGIYHISTIIEIDPMILPYLNAPYGSAFERIGNEFKEV